jgi:hypothetical protein
VNTFGRDELLSFLAEIDEMLGEPAAIEIVGGAAALLAYGAARPTKDVDCIGSLDEQIRRAARKTKLRIPIDRAAIADPPYDYEDRLQPLDLHLKKLTVWVPERHDLLLMKAVRAARHDVEVLQQVHKAQPFQLDLLLERFNREMGQAIIDPKILELQFAHIIEVLFGPAAAKKVERRSKKAR